MDVKNLNKNTMILHYKIEKKLGQGGMGVVYKAIDTKLQRHVAIKFLLGHYDDNSAKIRRFWEEARAVAQLSHRNILGIHHLETQDPPFLVMSYIEGVSLKDKLKNKTFSIPQVVKYMTKIANAMSYAHKKRVIHRDLKPENIMIDKEGEPIVMDFGLAKRMESDTKISRPGDIFGTPYYMSPEQGKGENETIDHRSDIFSLGVILYEMLTQSLPFKGSNAFMIIKQTVEEDPVAPSQINKKISPTLEKICLKALAKSRENRYSSCSRLVKDLQHSLSSNRSVAVKPRKQKQDYSAYILASVAVGAFIFFMMFVFFTNTNEVIENNTTKNTEISLFDENLQKGEQAFVAKNYSQAIKYLKLALEIQKSEKALALLEAIKLSQKKITKLQLFIDSPEKEVYTNKRSWMVRGRVQGEHPTVFASGIAALVRNNQFELLLPLEREGRKTFSIIATDTSGQRQEQKLIFFVDRTPPIIVVDNIEYVDKKDLKLNLNIQDINAWQVEVNGKSKISKKDYTPPTLSLTPGKNIVEIKAEDAASNVSQKKLNIYYSDKCPQPEILRPKNELSTRQGRIVVWCAPQILFTNIHINGQLTDRVGRRFKSTVNLSIGKNEITVMATDRFGRTSKETIIVFRKENLFVKRKNQQKNQQKKELSIQALIKNNFNASKYEFKKNNYVKFTYMFKKNAKALEDFNITPGNVVMQGKYLSIQSGLFISMIHKAIFQGDMKISGLMFSDSLNRVYGLSLCYNGYAVAPKLYVFGVSEKNGIFSLKKDFWKIFLIPETKNKIISVNKNNIVSMTLKKRENLLIGHYKNKNLFSVKDSDFRKGRTAIHAILNTELRIYKLTISGILDQSWIKTLD
ncbi:protein kinase [Candidatus Uabimicrobium sp. HlEnr_7]|uniref:serine/threonine-protein kinase n=1 Tax=Candidatus Uabimicrobium helgolandensis TaxID=3095367 RepID=UPI003557930B